MGTYRAQLELGDDLGEGYFGRVFRGKDNVHGDVAVKVITRNQKESAGEWISRKGDLLAEAQRLKQAVHKNVVEVFQLVESENDDAVLLVMEYCEGGSLQSSFENGPMALPRVRRIATQITLGLSIIHARGMLHRDIKPSNILLDATGVAKLGDFGLVTDNIIFGYGSAAGYLDHLAPEVHAGGGTSIASDIWAVGMTLFRLMHGEEWYKTAEPPADVVPDGGFADKLEWLPHIPKAWRTCIRKMLNDDPHSRHQNANVLLNALAELPTPLWRCAVTDAKINWLRTVGSRRIRVEWISHSQRKCEWSAVSAPVNSGRKRTLAGSNGVIGCRQAEQELRRFFDDREN